MILSFTHSCISRLSGRQRAGCQRSLLKTVFLFTHQNTENIPSNELSLPSPPKNKDPGSHSEQRLPYSRLPNCMASWCADDNAITRISVSAESSLAAVVPRPSLSLSVWGWNKASPWNRWVRSFPFFLGGWYETWLSDTDRTRSPCAEWGLLFDFIYPIWGEDMHLHPGLSRVHKMHEMAASSSVLTSRRSTGSFCSHFVALIFLRDYFRPSFLFFFDFSS